MFCPSKRNSLRKHLIEVAIFVKDLYERKVLTEEEKEVFMHHLDQMKNCVVASPLNESYEISKRKGGEKDGP